MPTMRQPVANRARCDVNTQSAIPRALQRPAATMAQRSPQRIVISDAGMLLSSEPMLIRATTSAAIGTEAPRSRAIRGMVGRTAPSPSPKSNEGPKAGTAIRLKENSVEEEEAGVAGGDGMQRVRAWTPAWQRQAGSHYRLPANCRPSWQCGRPHPSDWAGLYAAARRSGPPSDQRRDWQSR